MKDFLQRGSICLVACEVVDKNNELKKNAFNYLSA